MTLLDIYLIGIVPATILVVVLAASEWRKNDIYIKDILVCLLCISLSWPLIIISAAHYINTFSLWSKFKNTFSTWMSIVIIPKKIDDDDDFKTSKSLKRNK